MAVRGRGRGGARAHLNDMVKVELHSHEVNVHPKDSQIEELHKR